MFRMIGLALLLSPGVALAESTGSGFFINRDWVLTNDHVVEDCARVEVAGQGRARELRRDPGSDLAAIRLARPFDGLALPFRESHPRLAEALHVLGYPLSDVLSASVRVTSGSVSALDAFARDDGLIQISAPIQRGNSGGPVIDDAGAVLGVAVGILNRSGVQNVNFAISGALARGFLDDKGIGYAVASDSATDAEPLPDVIERVAAATVQVRCVGAGPPPAPPAAAQAPSGLVIFRDRDVIGFDYRFLRDTSFARCQTACEGDRQCRAFTYNTRHNACFLKEGGAVLVTNADAVSALAPDLVAGVVDSGFTIAADRDAPGGDYLRIRQSNFVGCVVECALDARCRAFAYVRATSDCWLKDRVGPIQRMPGVEFGLK